MLHTCKAPGVSGSNGARNAGMPVMASAPSVVPWYAVLRAITLWRPALADRRWKYWRASFHADSTASEPPVVKNTRLRSPGASSARLGRELDGGRVRVRPDREVLERLGLPTCGLGQLGATVADLHGEQARQAVEVAVAAWRPRRSSPRPAAMIGHLACRRRTRRAG